MRDPGCDGSLCSRWQILMDHGWSFARSTKLARRCLPLIPTALPHLISRNWASWRGTRPDAKRWRGISHARHLPPTRNITGKTTVSWCSMLTERGADRTLTLVPDESFPAILGRSAQVMVSDQEVRVIARGDRVAMKREAANKPEPESEKHKRDLECLERI